jgi:hypothetical protein
MLARGKPHPIMQWMDDSTLLHIAVSIQSDNLTYVLTLMTENIFW